jgi:arsenite/tail-anchored protein-transporting ATPase
MSATNISDPLLKQRAAAEVPLLDEIDKNHAKKLYAIPWISEHHILQTLISKQKKDVIA